MSGLSGGGGSGGGMSATLNSLLEKTSNWDKDERYMATNDLCNELQKDIKVRDKAKRAFGGLDLNFASCGRLRPPVLRRAIST